MSDASPPPLTSRGYEFLAMGLIGMNIVGWFVLALLSDWLPRWGLIAGAAVLALPIAWPLPWIAEAAGVSSFWSPTLAVLAVFVVAPWMWLNAVLWGRGLATLLRWMTSSGGN